MGSRLQCAAIDATKARKHRAAGLSDRQPDHAIIEAARRAKIDLSSEPEWIALRGSPGGGEIGHAAVVARLPSQTLWFDEAFLEPATIAWDAQYRRAVAECGIRGKK